jgi:hypothetical protein
MLDRYSDDYDFEEEYEDLEDIEDFEDDEDFFEFEGEEFADFADFEDFEDEDLFDPYDDESYFEDEADPLFGRLKRWARKAKDFAKKAAGRLARVAKKHAGKIGTVVGGAVAGPAGAAIGGKIGSVVKNLEDEDDGFDSEDEMEASIHIPANDEELAEEMAARATKSRPTDAQALGGALTITIMSRQPLKVKQVAPAVASAAGRIAKVLAADPPAKPLIKTLPTIVKKTTATLKRKAQTRKTVARVMTKQAKRTLGSQRRLAAALANNAMKRRKLNRKAIARAEKYY